MELKRVYVVSFEDTCDGGDTIHAVYGTPELGHWVTDQLNRNIHACGGYRMTEWAIETKRPKRVSDALV